MPAGPTATDGTGYNPTMGASYGQMAQYLSAKSGLDYHVALNWLKAEGSQQKGNPLGAHYGQRGPGLPTYYASWQQGLDAAVAMLRQGNMSGILAAIRGGSPAAERAAIVASPWSGSSHYGGGAHFSTAGISGATTGSAPGLFNPGATLDPSQVTDKRGAPGSTGSPLTGAVSASSELGKKLAAILAGMGLTDPAHVITGTEAQAIGRALGAQQMGHDLVGRTVGDVLGQANATDPITAVANAIGAIPGALGGLAVTLGILAVVGVLGWSGVKDLLGD